MSDHARRIACWSGPRNISTAMMRAWGARSDTAVTDEPFYAHYLLDHGHDHPGRDEILERQETDARRVVDYLIGPVPGGAVVWYQKHMAHHLTPDVPRSWLDLVEHAFLIRDPEDMLTSLMQVIPNPTLQETGLPQQVEIFERTVQRTGHTPPVLDARDVLDAPRESLTMLCEALDLPFEEAMLSWKPGRRDTDGVWAKHWYDAVERSTGFMPYTSKNMDVPEPLLPVLDGAVELYDRLARHKL